MNEILTTGILLCAIILIGNAAFKANKLADDMRRDRQERGRAFLKKLENWEEPQLKALVCPSCYVVENYSHKQPTRGNCHYCGDNPYKKGS